MTKSSLFFRSFVLLPYYANPDCFKEMTRKVKVEKNIKLEMNRGSLKIIFEITETSRARHKNSARC